MRLALSALLGFILAFSIGCQRSKAPISASDVAAAEARAQKEVSDARVEATKDVKSAVKVAGSQSREVAVAKATGSFDIAMAKADGEHQVALEKCLLLAASTRQACKDGADTAYQSAATTAKANRALQQR
jgi:hypothetical protein